MNKVAVSRRLAYVSLVLTLVPVVSVVAYAWLGPEPLDVTVQYAVSIVTWTSFGFAPVAATLAIWLGRGTAVRRLAAVALGSWLSMVAFLAYTSVR